MQQLYQNKEGLYTVEAELNFNQMRQDIFQNTGCPMPSLHTCLVLIPKITPAVREINT